ncbi:MAG: hypothetical protein ACXW1D_08130, partial [Halobacteriota archaeon]
CAAPTALSGGNPTLLALPAVGELGLRSEAYSLKAPGLLYKGQITPTQSLAPSANAPLRHLRRGQLLC